MPANPNLIASWIQYLKRNQIVAQASDPKTGKLNYKRPVTANDLTAFLKGYGGLDAKTIDAAIKKIASQKVKAAQKQPVQAPQQTPPAAPQPAQQVPAPQPKPRIKGPAAVATVKEAVVDLSGVEFDEKDVEAIFDLVTKVKQQKPKAAVVDPDAERAKKVENLNRLKRMIRDSMTPQQRKALWRALNG